jgi:phenylacetate-CoA ligase
VSDPLWLKKRSPERQARLKPAARARAAAVETLMREFEQTQWFPPEKIELYQFRMLRALASHAEQNSPNFHARLEKSGMKPEDLVDAAALRRLPVLTRRELQSADIYCKTVPPRHRPLATTTTSGSTGEPVVVKRTRINQLFWLGFTLRQSFWHERNFAQKLTIVRPNSDRYAVYASWGAPGALLFDTGQLQFIPITTDIAEIAEKIAAFDPAMLVVYPNVLAGLLRHCRAHGVTFPSLRWIFSISETLSPELRADAQEMFSAKVVQNYSSQELGIVALQCPDHNLYHIAAESMIVEVLDADGNPCKPGEVGRLVVTDLRNYATPLIRYQTGDYAERGAPCACGRGLPVLNRILGRERNLVLMPDGTKHWPLVGFAKFRDIAPIIQYQIVQDGRESLEMRLVIKEPLTETQMAELRKVIGDTLGFPFEMRFTYFDERLPPGANGKFEEFICRVSA